MWPWIIEKFDRFLAIGDDTPYFLEEEDQHRAWQLLQRGAALLLLASIIYLPTLTNGFIWLDQANVTGARLGGMSGFASVWLTAAHGGWRPIAGSLWWLEYQCFGSAAGGYHAISIILQGFNGILLWMILRRLNVPGAWLAAALFIAHPLQVQTVAWVSEQPTLLASALALTSVRAWLRLNSIFPSPDAAASFSGPDFQLEQPPERVIRLYLLAVFLFAASALCSPVAAGLPLVLVLILAWKFRQITRRQWLALAPMFAIAAVALGLGTWESRAQPDALAMNRVVPGLQRIGAAASALGAYVTHAIFPGALPFAYPDWTWPSAGWYLIPLAGLLMVGAMLWFGRRRLGIGPALAIFSYLALLLLPVCGLFWTPRDAVGFAADHIQYLALAPLVALVAAAIVRVVALLPAVLAERAVRVAMGIALLAILGTLALYQTAYYADEPTLWSTAIAKSPNSVTAREHYAQYLIQSGNLAQASQLLGQARDIDGPDPTILVEQASVYRAQGQYSDAIRCLLHADEIDPHNLRILSDLANTYLDDGRLETAMNIAQQLLQIQPGDPATLTTAGLIRAGQHRLPEAIKSYNAAISADPRYTPARIDLANALFAQGNLIQAAEQLKEVVAIDPRNFAAFMNAGAMLERLKAFPSAEYMFRAAVLIKPEDAEAFDDLGVSQAAQGDLRDAAWSFARALQLDPNSTEARQHLNVANRQVAAATEPADDTDTRP
jgi:tetratricopeptide (TPR) repeat protein